MEQELFNALLPYIISALGTVITAVAAWLGSKLGKYIDSQKESKLIREIISKTVQYVEQVGKSLGSEEKFDLAKQKAIEWANSKGLQVSEIELEILIEAFVNEFYGSYFDPNESVVSE